MSYSRIGALHKVNNKSATARGKHVDVKLQYNEAKMQSGEIETRYVASEENAAGIFTKPLPRIAFHKLQKILVHGAQSM